MFSIEQKRVIADAVQEVLRDTGHPELPDGEIEFHLHVEGKQKMISWADIKNNGAVLKSQSGIDQSEIGGVLLEKEGELFGNLTPCCSVSDFAGKEKFEILGNPETGEMTVKERTVLEPGDIIQMAFKPEKVPASMKGH